MTTVEFKIRVFVESYAITEKESFEFWSSIYVRKGGLNLGVTLLLV